jgi:pyruvate decarboxylase
VPGDFTLALLDEFLKETGLTMVGCCNELNAGYAADGYCRATKGLGVAMGIKKYIVLPYAKYASLSFS